MENAPSAKTTMYLITEESVVQRQMETVVLEVEMVTVTVTMEVEKAMMMTQLALDKVTMTNLKIVNTIKRSVAEDLEKNMDLDMVKIKIQKIMIMIPQLEILIKKANGVVLMMIVNAAKHGAIEELTRRDIMENADIIEIMTQHNAMRKNHFQECVITHHSHHIHQAPHQAQVMTTTDVEDTATKRTDNVKANRKSQDKMAIQCQSAVEMVIMERKMMETTMPAKEIMMERMVVLIMETLVEQMEEPTTVENKVMLLVELKAVIDCLYIVLLITFFISFSEIYK